MKIQLKKGMTEPRQLQQRNQLSLSLRHPSMHVQENSLMLVGQEHVKKNAFGIRTNISLKIELDLLLIRRYWQNLVGLRFSIHHECWNLAISRLLLEFL